MTLEPCQTLFQKYRHWRTEGPLGFAQMTLCRRVICQCPPQDISNRPICPECNIQARFHHGINKDSSPSRGEGPE